MQLSFGKDKKKVRKLVRAKPCTGQVIFLVAKRPRLCNRVGGFNTRLCSWLQFPLIKLAVMVAMMEFLTFMRNPQWNSWLNQSNPVLDITFRESTRERVFLLPPLFLLLRNKEKQNIVSMFIIKFGHCFLLSCWFTDLAHIYNKHFYKYCNCSLQEQLVRESRERT